MFSSARRPKLLTTFAKGPSFVKPTLPRPPCWTRLGLMLRAFSPPVPLCRSSHWSRRSAVPFTCTDFTLLLPLTAAGLPRRAGGRPAGAALLIARRAKERTYPELCRSNRCRLTVIALEIGGVVRLLARCRARSVPPPPRAAAISVFTLRWPALLSFAAASWAFRGSNDLAFAPS